MVKKFLFLSLFLMGCASINFRIVGWYNTDPDDIRNRVELSNGTKVSIIGNPRIACFNKENIKLTEGYFVTVENNYLVVDEYGKGYNRIPNGLGNYCTLGGN